MPFCLNRFFSLFKVPLAYHVWQHQDDVTMKITTRGHIQLASKGSCLYSMGKDDYLSFRGLTTAAEEATRTYASGVTSTGSESLSFRAGLNRVIPTRDPDNW